LPILSFSITFILVVVAVLLVAKLTEKLVDVVGMGFFNHLGGAALGLLKGIILISILIFVVSSIDHNGKWIAAKDKNGSFFYTKAAKVFPRLMKTFREEIKFPNW
jgi:membrane protein required for colicin V production